MAKKYLKIAFAKLANRAPSVVTAGIKAGRIFCDDQGVDPEHPTNKKYLERCAVYDAENGRPLKAVDARDRPVANGAVKHPRRKIQPVEVDDKSYNLPPRTRAPRGSSKLAHSKQLKLEAEIEGRQLKNDALRNVLVEREGVRRVFGALYKIDVDELRTIGTRVAPEIANLCGIDDGEMILKIAAQIEKEIFVSLRHIQKELNDFLRGVQAAEIRSKNDDPAAIAK